MVTMEERMSTVEQEVSSIKATLEHLATKADLAEVKSDLARLDAKFDAKLEKTVSDLTWRMFGMMLGLMVAFGTLVAAAQTIFD